MHEDLSKCTTSMLIIRLSRACAPGLPVLREEAGRLADEIDRRIPVEPAQAAPQGIPVEMAMRLVDMLQAQMGKAGGGC